MAMTESEARSKIKYRLGIARQIAGNGVDGKSFEEFEIALQALKEIREYRELGTVEELKALKEKNEPKEMDRYCCPICRHYFEDTDAYNYCPVCGQKMKSILE